jgi:hypothetical protein
MQLRADEQSYSEQRASINFDDLNTGHCYARRTGKHRLVDRGLGPIVTGSAIAITVDLFDQHIRRRTRRPD